MSISLKDAILPEYDREMTATRRVLERVPAGALGWAPHAKSRTMGELAAHLPAILRLVTVAIERSACDLAGEERAGTPPGSIDEVLAAWDGQVKQVRAMLATRSDAELMALLTLERDGHEIFTMPKIGIIRMLAFNHIIHHRGQLTVYLRLNGVPVPSIYGASADEKKGGM